MDLKTNELIRTTYIGEPYDPKYQILLGLCDKTKHTVEMWKLKQVPYDNWALPVTLKGDVASRRSTEFF